MTQAAEETGSQRCKFPLTGLGREYENSCAVGGPEKTLQNPLAACFDF